jgi:hypothetical protein
VNTTRDGTSNNSADVSETHASTVREEGKTLSEATPAPSQGGFMLSPAIADGYPDVASSCLVSLVELRGVPIGLGQRDATLRALLISRGARRT